MQPCGMRSRFSVVTHLHACSAGYLRNAVSFFCYSKLACVAKCIASQLILRRYVQSSNLLLLHIQACFVFFYSSYGFWCDTVFLGESYRVTELQYLAKFFVFFRLPFQFFLRSFFAFGPFFFFTFRAGLAGCWRYVRFAFFCRLGAFQFNLFGINIPFKSVVSRVADCAVVDIFARSA